MKKIRRIFAAVMATAMLLTFAPALATANFGNNNDYLIIIIHEEKNSQCHCGLDLIRQSVLVSYSYITACTLHSGCNLYSRMFRDRVRCINTFCDTWIWVTNIYRGTDACW